MKVNFRFSTKVTLFILNVVNLLSTDFSQNATFLLTEKCALKGDKINANNCHSFSARGKLSGAIQITWQ